MAEYPSAGLKGCETSPDQQEYFVTFVLEIVLNYLELLT